MTGPLISGIMADHGAEVIKIESPEGDPTRAGKRTRPSQHAGDSFSVLNRGKQSVVLDLKQEQDREVALQLIRSADVLVESFSPGVTERLGIGADTVRKLNPRLVYCSVSAFGQHGPLRDSAGHDPAVQAAAGILPRDAQGRPVIPSVSVAAWCSAQSALAGILMALLAARASGLGDHIDLSMHDVALSTRPNALFKALSEPADTSEQTLGYAMLEPYESADGLWFCLGAGETRFAKALLGALDRPDLVAIALATPGAAQDPLRVFLKDIFKTRPISQWMAWFAERSISAAPVLDYATAMRHPHVRAREMLLVDEHGDTHLNTPIRFASEPGKPNLRVPMLGEHTDLVIAGLQKATAAETSR